jgi:hypothetical protein
MRINCERKLARKTPVYDHSNTILFHADREKAATLMSRQDIDVIGSDKRIRGLRFRGPDPAHQMSGCRVNGHKIAQPHKRENYYNVRGMWHIDRVPDIFLPHFTVVLTGCFYGAPT